MPALTSKPAVKSRNIDKNGKENAKRGIKEYYKNRLTARKRRNGFLSKKNSIFLQERNKFCENSGALFGK